MRKLWLIQKDQEAVSPVIATILMVAITVVLAAVLYVMVSCLLGSGQTSTAKSVGISLSQSGSNWTLLISSVSSSGIGLASATLSIFDANGNPTIVSGKTLSFLNTAPWATWHVKYICKLNPCETDISVQARINVDVTTYPANYAYELADASSILAKGNFK